MKYRIGLYGVCLILLTSVKNLRFIIGKESDTTLKNYFKYCCTYVANTSDSYLVTIMS